MPVALLPASAAPVTAPLAAPVTAPITTSRTAFFALLITPGDERLLVDFLLDFFLADPEDADFFVVDFLAFFDGMSFSLLFCFALSRSLHLPEINKRVSHRASFRNVINEPSVCIASNVP